MTEREARYQEYWQGFRAYCARTGATFPLRAAPPKYYFLIPLDYTGFSVSLLAAQKRGQLRCELYLDKEGAEEHFAALRARKGEIEGQLGPLDWTVEPGRAGQHIVCAGPHFDLYDRASWETNYRWLKAQAERFLRTFTPYARELSAR